MARDHARVLVSIWGDADWRELPAAAQRLYILALSQPELSYAGVVPYLPGRWSGFCSDTSQPAIRRGIATLVDRRYVVLDDSTDELFLRTFVRHDNVLRFPNVAVSMARAFRQISSPTIRSAFLEELHDLAERPDTKDLPGWTRNEVAALLMEER